jgi:chromosome segregation ATPase
LQVGNDGLGAQVRDLQLQRDDLKTQCNDLRERLTTVERERQAGTAGLLLAQRRLLELDAAGSVVPLGPAWWRRSSTWGMAVVFLLVGGTMGLEVHESRTARAAAREDASELEGRLGDLARDLDEVQKSGSRALEQLTTEREAWDAERQTLEERGSAGDERVAELDAHLQAAREAALADRRLLEESLAEARTLTGSVREELTREREESRAERARTAELLEERERAAAAERAATTEALADLTQRAGASTEAAETLAAELAQRRVDEERRTALLLAEIERLGTRLPGAPPASAESVPDWDPVEDERARRWLFGLHLPGMLQTPTEGGR